MLDWLVIYFQLLLIFCKIKFVFRKQIIKWRKFIFDSTYQMHTKALAKHAIQWNLVAPLNEVVRQSEF